MFVDFFGVGCGVCGLGWCGYTVKQVKWWRYCLARCDKIVNHFALFRELYVHTVVELCNSFISQIQRNPLTLSNSVVASRCRWSRLRWRKVCCVVACTKFWEPDIWTLLRGVFVIPTYNILESEILIFLSVLFLN